MKATIRVEEEETDQETREWKNAIKDTKDKIIDRLKKLKQPPQPPDQPQPGQPPS